MEDIEELDDDDALTSAVQCLVSETDIMLEAYQHMLFAILADALLFMEAACYSFVYP